MNTISNYYPFGMLIKERSFSSTAYKYGFNGKEKDDEVNVEGGSYDYGARIYDGRLGRWLSLDPLMKKYPSINPYHFCYNTPILFMDPDGRHAIAILVEPPSLVKDGTSYAAGTLENPNQITIKANFYYNVNQINSIYDENAECLVSAIKELNTVTQTIKANDGKYYVIKFDLAAIPIAVAEGENVDEKLQEVAMLDQSKELKPKNNPDEPDEYINYARYGNVAGEEINTCDTRDKGSSIDFRISSCGSNINKEWEIYNTNNTDIANEKFKYYKQTWQHEIGHNFGLVDNYFGKRGGIMKAQQISPSGNSVSGYTPKTQVNKIENQNLLDIANLSLNKIKGPSGNTTITISPILHKEEKKD